MRKIMILVMFAALVAVTSCGSLQTRQQKGTAAGTAIGAATGAALGQAIGRNTEATVLGALAGAVVGGIAGNQIGAYMDRQEQALRSAVATSDAVAVARDQDVLTATFKSDVLFDFDSAVLKPGAYTEIDRVVNVLNQYPQTVIRVEGHTDTTGSETYNQKLSERRALAVKNAITQRGVDPQRVEAIGYGESMTISSSHAMNRRVNVVIVPVRTG